ncbi:unnamed protein product [Dovyalis caffra]|uniref:Leucine-rich repeat-containing N-terminal plant-type domain-containing protein n=1 Tax=Dovyalis caffra TaxID=77055 RepID=A0AAV1RQX7_9ROSI|nr:unnamed protein product [Dovyalis caffra]
MKISISFATLVPILLLCLSFPPTIALAFNHGNFTRVLCSSTERDALLKLKHDLTDPSNRLASWVSDEDCCRWHGIVRHGSTGHVIELNLRSLSFQEYHDTFHDVANRDYEDYTRLFFLSGKINPSLLNLKHLVHLDLSNNDFGGTHIPKFVGSPRSLKYLNLSRAWIWSGLNLGRAFDWLEVINDALPSLVRLHLSRRQLPPVPLLVNVNFSSLSIIDLSFTYYYSSIRVLKFPSWISHLKNPVSPNLGNNYFEGPIPNNLQNLTSLRELDPSGNQFNSSIPNRLYGFSCLELLNLGFNNLQGEVSSAIENMTSLIDLDLSDNYELEFNRGIPTSFKNLCNLKVLSLSSLKLETRYSREIPSGTQLQSFSPYEFMGNELCGPPLSKNCSGVGTTQDPKNRKNEDGDVIEFNWFYVSMALGFIVGFWSTVGPLLFNRRCGYVYFHFLDRLWDKIWLYFHVNLPNWKLWAYVS